jgi:NADH dehydrogenase
MEATAARRHRIVIVGGGFAGAALLPRLIAGLPADWEAVLLSEESSTTFSPMLPEVVGAAIFPEQVAAPLRQVIGTRRAGARARFIMGRVTAVERTARRLELDSLNGPQTLHYDQLVLATGLRARLDLLPGLEAHGHPVKTVGDALHVRNLVLERLAEMELEPDPARRAALGRLLVVGGGFSGVEVAGSLACFLRSAGRSYPGADPALLKVCLVQDLDRLLPELSPELGASALATLRRHGVEVRLSTSVKSVDAGGATLATGERIASATVIATIGTRPSSLVAGLGLPLNRGRLVAGPDFRVAGEGGLWALGDCASVINAHDGNHCPPTAQFAVRQGRWLAENLLAAVRGEAPRPFRYRPRGALAAIGHLDGVADIFGLKLSGLPAWLAWRAYYLSQIPTFGRKLRIFVEWTWAMAFPLDITHLSFQRSSDRAAAEAATAAAAEAA